MGPNVAQTEQDSEAVTEEGRHRGPASCQRRIAIPLIAPINPGSHGIFLVFGGNPRKNEHLVRGHRRDTGYSLRIAVPVMEDRKTWPDR